MIRVFMTKKIAIRENVHLTEAQIKELVERYGESDYRLMIEKLSTYKRDAGRHYSSDFMAIKRWVINWLKDHKGRQVAKQTASQDVLRAYKRFTYYLERINDPVILNRGKIILESTSIRHLPSQRTYPLTADGLKKVLLDIFRLKDGQIAAIFS